MATLHPYNTTEVFREVIWLSPSAGGDGTGLVHWWFVYPDYSPIPEVFRQEAGDNGALVLVPADEADTARLLGAYLAVKGWDSF